MSLQLSSYDRELLSGARGPAARMAMSILMRMAAFHRAESLLDITQAHIDSSIYMGEAGLEFAERLVELGAAVVVPTTLNVSGLDAHHWQQWSVPREWAHKARRQMIAYKKMGCRPTWTCAPYQLDELPRRGQQIAWGESNAIAFVNSVIGARTERYPDLLDICAAITGRVPAVGLHLTANRAGQVLLDLTDIPIALQQNDTFYPVLGHFMGRIAGERIPVVAGLQVQPHQDQLKALGAAAAASGAVGLFHLVGITPEAPTAEAAFQGRPPQETAAVTLKQLRDARQALSTAEGTGFDMIVLGCPHFSLSEFETLHGLLTGKRTHRAVRFLVTTSRAVREQATAAGYIDSLDRFGGQVTVDTCILASPMLPASIGRIMTNSAKTAYYTPGMLERQVFFGSLADCVASAVAGQVIRDDSLWQ